MWQEVLVAMAVVSTVMCETTPSADDEVTGTGMLMTTVAPITEFSLIFNHIESSTSSIKFMWEALVPKWMKVQSYAITASQKDSEAVMTYPELPSYEDFFEAKDLVKDSKYDVCIISNVINDTESVEFRDCFDSFTIPYVRPDSIYVLFIVIAYILLMILIGYVSWRCAVAKAEKQTAAGKTGKTESDCKQQTANIPEEQKPILLSSPSDDQPKSSIEDEDIPYITPPWSEMEHEERFPLNSFSHI